MALHARLAAPTPAPRTEWPWHHAGIASIPAHLLWRGDRRLEAENYLSNGHGLRLAIQGRAAGWKPLVQFAQVTQPSRTKATLVSSEFGTPFIAATQVFDIRPVPRKWLAVSKISDAAALSTKAGSILVTRSGAVGRATIATIYHEGLLISDDLLRVTSTDENQSGWVYAYLRSPQARAMMTGVQYGHIIKHLEVGHLNALPVPVLKEKRARKFRKQVAEILDFRNRAHQLTLDAEDRFARAFKPLKVEDNGESGYTLQASALFTGRRRLEGVFYNPGAAAIRRHLRKSGNNFVSLQAAGFKVWLPTRFRRVPASDGIPFLDSADLFEINPDVDKCIADSDFGDPFRGRVKLGWLLLARSGQTYGISGSVVLSTEALEEKVISDHVIRIAPGEQTNLRVGYLHTALSHPLLGRPLVKCLPYGSSIPAIDPTDLSNLEVVRLTLTEESAIADLAEESARLRAQADVLERAVSEDAGRLVERFVAGDMLEFVTAMPVSNASEMPKPAPTALIEHSRVRLRRALSEANLPVGAAGTVVHVYKGGKGYEVEFTEGRKHPVVETLFPADVEPLTGEDE